jgi:hypothetical protein
MYHRVLFVMIYFIIFSILSQIWYLIACTVLKISTPLVHPVGLQFYYIISITSFHPFSRYGYQFRYLQRPLGLQEDEALRFCRQLTHEGSKDVSPRHRLPLPTRPVNIHSTHFC